MSAVRLSRGGRWFTAALSTTLAASLTLSLSPVAMAEAPAPQDASAAALAEFAEAQTAEAELLQAAVAAEEAAAKHVLIFTETTQFRHTEAIDQGVPLLAAALTAANISSEWANDSTGFFTPAKLATFDSIIIFNASGAPWNASEQAAFIAYQQAGGSVVGIHNATDMRSDWAWFDDMVGTKMPGHAATGNSPGPTGVVRVEDQTHPSTEGLPQRWQRGDEWYNYSTNVRGSAHVLATMDETTYTAGTNAMGYDHPISWCDTYDGGKVWMTGMGHFGAHYQEPNLMKHIIGGVEWATGLKDGDCGGTKWDSYEKVALDTNTSAPFGMEVLPDGRVLFTELVRGQIRVYNPITQVTSTAITIPVYSGGEDGLLGIVAARDFVTTGHIYVYYAPASTNDSNPVNFFSQVSRFTMVGDTIAANTEKVLIKFPARRLPDEPGHTGGSLGMNAQGDLFIGIGDDVNPHSEPSGGYAPLSTRNGTFHDARETSANTNDLRGKLLRIHPEANGTYSIPAGNLFPVATSDPTKTRPEIYAMGFRNPFRFSVDQETGWVGLADYSPDNGNDAPTTRGPAGIAEWNLIKTPGNYGWPLCMGNNEPFRTVDYGTTSAGPVVVGDFFDCNAPVNNSPRNTGLTNLPPAKAADMWYGYKRQFSAAIPQGGGLAPMGGPFYEYNENLDSDTKFPESYDGKPFFYDWARNKMFSLNLKTPATASGSQVEKVTPFLPNESFLAPIDSKFGPDGSLYILDWGGGYGRDNPTSGLHKIDYISGSRSPAAVAKATPDSGPAPLTVTFKGDTSSDPENETLTYAWDFDGNGTTDSTVANPTHTYTTVGVYNARLTVSDPNGKDGTTTVPITVGNTRPVVNFTKPINGGFFEFGDDLSWAVTVTDAETTVVPSQVIVQPALGHDYHAHPTAPQSGLSGNTLTSLGGHEITENIFYAIDARFTDQAQGAAPALTGSATTVVFPKKRQAEFFSTSSPDVVKSESRDVEGGGQVITAANGGWVSFNPLSLFQVPKLSVRVAANSASTIELRRDSPSGPLLGTAAVPATGGLSKFTDVVVNVTDPGVSFELFMVFPGAGDRRVNFIEAIGKGVSPVSRPTVSITAPASNVQLPQGSQQITATAADQDGTVAKVEFFVDGVSLGAADTTAPYAATWNPTADKVYNLTAVATNSAGLTTTSRIVTAQVGELFGAFQTFSNIDGQFEALGSNKFAIVAAGENMWQGVNQYSTLFLPGGADEDWIATVKVNSQQNTNGGAKAGIIVRNDITATGTSPGYAALGIRPSGGFEWLRDAVSPAGQLDASTAAGTSTYPAWVRISRNGPDYQAYWSKDGTNFTAIGGPVTLPGSASVQDIGFFTTAHSATAGRVEFEGWTFDDNPDFEEPPIVNDPPPSCVGLRSDQFDGTTLDTQRWSVVRNAAGKPITVSGGNAVLPVVVGDINEAELGPISYIGQAAPTGAWEVVTKVTAAHSTHWQYGGILLHVNDDNYVKLAFVKNQNGNRFLEFQQETNGTRNTPAAPAVATTFPAAAYLKMTSNGTNITGAYSADGTTWITLAGSIPVKANATIGLVAAGDTGTGNTNATFDFFNMTPPGTSPVRSVDDEFDGTALDGCRWNNVVRYDSSKVAVAGGELRITTQLGDIDNANPISPRNFILQKAPTGDWTLQTKFKANQVHRWQYAGLLAYGNDDNYVKLDVVAKNLPGVALDLGAELASEKNAASSGGNRQLDIANSSESGYWYLKLTKTGSSYQGWVSDGGINWTSLGAPVVNDTPITAFGLIAVGPQQETPVTIAFDYFHQIIDGPADTTAPVTTGTVSAANPAIVTLAATDNTGGSGVSKIEYRIAPSTTWLPYTTPVSVPKTSAAQTVEFRATDVALNVEATKSVIVPAVVPPADTTAPVTTGTVSAANPAIVTLTATDNTGGSGVSKIEYRIAPSTTWIAYTTPVSVPKTSAAQTVEFRATDVAGNVEATKSVTVPAVVPPADTTAPVTTGTVSAADPAVVTLTATDAGGSGVSKIEYRLVPSTTWVTYTAPVSVPKTASIQSVEFRATDSAGNVEATKSVQVPAVVPPADTTAPVAVLTIAPVAPVSGWHTSEVLVSVSATDNKDAAPVRQINLGSGWVGYAAPVTLSADGTVVVQARASDVAGNVSEVKTVTVKIDKVAPVSSATVDEVARTVTIAGADATSGLDRIEYKIGSGDWATYTEPVTVAGTAAATVFYRAVDKAGHVEAVREAAVPATGVVLKDSVTVGATAPSLTYGSATVVSVRVSGAGGVPSGDVEVRLDDEAVGTATLANGRASVTLTEALPAGSHSLTVVYAGDAEFAGSTDTVEVTVAKATSTVTGTLAASTVRYGNNAVITVKVTAPGGTPEGAVTVKSGNAVLGSGMLVDGSVTFTIRNNISVKVHQLVVSYAGNSNLAASTVTVPLTVLKAKSTVKAVAPPTTMGKNSAKVVRLQVTTTPTVSVIGNATVNFTLNGVVKASTTAQIRAGAGAFTWPAMKVPGVYRAKIAFNPTSTVEGSTTEFIVTVK